MHIPEPVRIQADSQNLADQILSLRSVSGVYILFSGGTPLHLSSSTNLERRLQRLLLPAVSGHVRSARPLRKQLDSVECWPTGSRLELQILLYRLAKCYYPERYLDLLKLRMPWFVALTGAATYPRLESTSRPGPKFDVVCGPFRTRAAAQQYEQEVTSLFQIRRCNDVLLPSPEHPGCIYGEMNQCLRPCQCAVTAAEYESEASRVRNFLLTNGRSSISVLVSSRGRACQDMDFEQADQIHKRIEKLKAAAALRDPVISEIGSLNGIALTRSRREGQCILWPMLHGCWQDAITLDLSRHDAQPESLDSELREALSRGLSKPHPEGNQAEEIAVFSRWYHSSWRDGEWFPFTDLSRLNYRKLVRELGKVVQPEPLPAR